WIDASHVERQRADRLGRIHAERGADAATCRADRLEVDQPAVGPMTLRDGDNCGRTADQGGRAGGPMGMARPRARYEAGRGLACNERDFRQRRYVGTVQEGDVIRDVEEMTLTRKRRRSEWHDRIPLRQLRPLAPLRSDRDCAPPAAMPDRNLQ